MENGASSHSFSYSITIENQGKDSVQLLDRHWDIKDSLSHTKVVAGEGVLGLRPILLPGETHTYSSGCLLFSTIGAMSGYYSMINFNTDTIFKVPIPLFKLFAPYSIN